MRNNFIFLQSNYREVINYKIKNEGHGRGYRTTLANAAGCQPAYFSQILSFKVNLTLDQAASLSDYWGFSELEADFFLTLIELERSGTVTLKTKLKKRLNRIIDISKKQNREQQVISTAFVSENDALKYYSSWTTSAVHIFLQYNPNSTVKEISNKLKIEEFNVEKIVLQLESANIIKRNHGEIIVISNQLHVKDFSIYAPLHHKNWRNKASEFFEFGVKSNNLHYTAVCSLNKKDFLKVRKIFNDSIKDSESIILNSKEDTMACLNIDWFEIL